MAILKGVAGLTCFLAFSSVLLAADVNEIGVPQELIGTIAAQNSKGGSEYYILTVNEGGSDVTYVLNSERDFDYREAGKEAFESNQKQLKALVGKRVKLLGQRVSAMELARDGTHITHQWLRVISITEIFK